MHKNANMINIDTNMFHIKANYLHRNGNILRIELWAYYIKIEIDSKNTNILGKSMENKLHKNISCKRNHKQKYIAKSQKLHFWN